MVEGMCRVLVGFRFHCYIVPTHMPWKIQMSGAKG